VAGTLDDIDRQILAELTRDGRMSMRTLAERLHVSRANAYARVERLRAAKVIKGFRADIDPVAAGLGTSAYVTVNLHQAEWRDVGEQLRALPGVVHIALVGGRDNAALGRLVLDVIQGMPGVVNTRTLLVFEEADPMSATAIWEQ
jgi:DNA-binding Lrp family transcriptional regulator